MQTLRRGLKAAALFLMVPGVVLLVSGVAIDLDGRVALHTASVVTGGALVASAHIGNLG